MQGPDFLKTVRKNFDPCFRYVLMVRQTPFKDNRAFSDVLNWVEIDDPAVIDYSFHRDEASNTVALVIKLRPNDSTPFVQHLVGSRLPEDIVFYIYESQERFCEQETDTRSKEDSGQHP